MGWGRSIRKDRGGSGFVGCMSGVLQLFDFHQLAAFERFTTISSSSLYLPSTTPDQGRDTFFCSNGTEAPRNSLEVLSCRNVEEQHDEHDDDMDFEVFTGYMNCEKDDQKSKHSFKGKNPSVVARLMGLEILPDIEMLDQQGRERDYFAANTCSRSTRSRAHYKPSCHTEPNLGLRALQKRSDNIFLEHEPATTSMLCRSLPESPRISSGRRSDVDHHRLSLQMNKENLLPSINVGAVDTSSSSSSHLRNYSAAKKTNHFSSKPTSPRLVLSSNSPRLLKTREEKTNPNKQSNPSCSPRIRCKPDGDDGAVTAATATAVTAANANAKPRLQICQPNSSSSPRFSHAITSRLSSNPATSPGQPKTAAESTGSKPTTTRLSSATTNRSRKPKLEAMRMVGEIMPKKNNRREINCVGKCVSPVKKGQTPISGNNTLLRGNQRGVAAPHPSQLVVVSTAITKDDDECRSSTTWTRTAPNGKQKSVAITDEEGSVDIIQDGTWDLIDPRNNGSRYPKKLTLSSLLERERSGVHKRNSRDSTGTTPVLWVYPFIKKILESMGVTSETKVSFTNWYSPSHPLDPAILAARMLHDAPDDHRRDDDDGGDLQRGHHHARMSDIRSNRKLVFDLIDESLRERLRSHLSLKPWMMAMRDEGSTIGMMAMTGKKLLDGVWKDVNLFRPADCRIVEDVDAIVSRDIATSHHSSTINESSFEPFSETILFGIGSDIADALVAESVVDMLST